LFKGMAGVNIVRIGYKGNGAMLNDLLAGQIQLSFGVITSSMPHVKSGRLRALGVTSLQRSVQAPEVPTIAASGLPGYESLSITGMFAPARTPDAVVGRLNREIVAVLRNPDFKQKFSELGAEPVGSSPQEFSDKIKSEIAKWGKLIQQAGIRDE
jgi:tripartite-type tricarboxylate transporter receptor subunit TctC